MPMRVIAGELRHRKLEGPTDNKDIRPTKDRIREAFFSSLGNIEGKSFLDLYAGSGSMGIEAVSRGAQYSTFVDCSDIALRYVRNNIRNLNITNAEVIKSYDVNALEKFKNESRQFDIIYLDPPYESDRYEIALDLIFDNNIVSEKGIVAIEINRDIEIKPSWNVTIKEYHYGEIKVIVLRK